MIRWKILRIDDGKSYRDVAELKVFLTLQCPIDKLFLTLMSGEKFRGYKIEVAARSNRQEYNNKRMQ